MSRPIDEVALSHLLPGTWRIGATNFPMWIDGGRRSPTFHYEEKRSSPLVLTDTVSWFTDAGVEKRLVGTDRWEGSGFRWRGRGLLSLFSSKWSVIGASAHGDIIAIRFSKSIATPAGVDIVVKEGTDSHTIRTVVANDPDTLGLSHGEFASLTWLETAERNGDTPR